MKKPTAATLVLSCLITAWSSAIAEEEKEETYLEPHVKRIEGVLPPSVCQHLIDLGEQCKCTCYTFIWIDSLLMLRYMHFDSLSVAGFDVQEESIDRDEQEDSEFDPDVKYVPSQTIDVYNRRDPDEDMQDPVIWEAVQPWIPKIAQIVKDNRNKVEVSKLLPDNPDKEPSLDWVFFRKYSPDDERNSLKHHHDTNMNTVNIELSNDYQGGGLFYIKPLASTGNISEVYAEVGYEWINTLKRESTSSIVFPDMHAGDAIFYNYTVEHGVAPCETGTRVSKTICILLKKKKFP